MAFMSCDSKSKYKIEIEDLSARWGTLADRTIKFSKETSENVKEWQGMYQSMYAGLSTDDFSEEQLSQVNELKMICLSHGDIYVEIQEILDMKVKMMESKGLIIQTLMLALENKELPTDVQIQLDSLNAYCETEEKVIAEFEEMTLSTKKKCLSTCADFAQLVPIEE